MRKVLVFAVVILVLAHYANAFSQKDIISPAAGTWNNLQPLVLNVQDGTEIYYSTTGIDPLRFGFAYDRPVVLNQKGNVSLRIVAVSSGGIREDFTIEYTVKDSEVIGNEKAVSFINDIALHPIKKYVSGSVFSIPESFNYCIDGNDRVFSGTDLHISEKNNASRYVPFTVTDGSTYLHFVLHVVPLQDSFLHSQSVPFEIENWNVISFSSRKYSYCVDDGEWSNEISAFLLDRLVPHTIKWKKKSSDENEDEEIVTYKLPPMPQLVSSIEQYGQVTFSLIPAPNDIDNSMSYKLGHIPQNLSLIEIDGGLYDSITIDAFYGEELASDFYAGVYYDGVYQGVLKQPVIVDRLSPIPPVISSYNDIHTVLTVQAEEGATIYYSISEPLDFEADGITAMEDVFADVRTGEYIEFVKGKVVLSSVSDRPTFYKVHSYAVDRAGNKSDITEYRLVVDEHNFYLNPMNYSSEGHDGSYSNPFATLDEAMSAVNARSKMRLHILGNITVSEDINITSDCDIIGRNSCILFLENAVMSVSNACVTISECSITKKTSDINDKNLVRVSDGTVLFDGCQISALFAKDGVLVESSSASVKFDNTTLTVHASSYACNVRTWNSSVTATDVSVVAVAHTCVNFSLEDSSCAISSSSSDIFAHIGRTMECVKCNLFLEHNVFKASLTARIKTSDVEAVWKDADTKDFSHDNNIVYGL